MKTKIDLLSGSVADKILLFALPLALTGILQQLFNATDVMVVGRFASKYAMAAVGSNTPVIGILLNLFIGISVGVNVVIARFIGQKKGADIRRTVGNAVVLSVVGGIFLAVLGQLIARPVLSLMSVPDEVFPMAIAYFRIYMAGMPAILLYNFEAAIFRAGGDTKTPLVCLLVAGAINVCLNMFFVIVLGRDADGVAVATVISNLISALVMLLLLLRSRDEMRLEKSSLRPDAAVLREILRLGVPAGVQAMLFSFSNIIIQSAINSLGADIMAASSAAFNVEIFSYFLVNAFGQACTTFIGQNYGAEQFARCRKVTRSAFILDMAFSAVMSLLIVAFAHRILALFNDDPAVVAYGRTRIMYITPFQLVNVLMEIFSGTLRGYGQSLAPAAISFFGVCAVRIVWVCTAFAARGDFNTLLTCYPLSWTLTALILTAYYLVFMRRLAGRTGG